MTYTLDIPEERKQAVLDALWYAGNQREKMTEDHQYLLTWIGKQIRKQDMNARVSAKAPHP